MDIDRNIDRCSTFTDNIGSGNLTDTFYQNSNKFNKTGQEWGVGWGVTPPYPPLDTPLMGRIKFSKYIQSK